MKNFFISLTAIGAICATAKSALPQPTPPVIPTVSGANADANVAWDANTGVFTYSYLVANSSASIGLLDHFIIDITTTTGGVPLSSAGLANSATGYIQNISQLNIQKLGTSIVPVGFISQPSGWSAGIDADGGASWSWSALTAAEIAPGRSMSGFVMQSPGIPGMRRFDVAAYFEPGLFFPTNEDDPDDVQLAANAKANAAALTCMVKGMTVGPVSPPSLTDSAQLVDFLISLKHQAASAGWLRGKEFIDRLDDKLEQAKKDISGKRDSAARDNLRQFIAMLEELRKKEAEERLDHNDGRRHDRDRDGDRDKDHDRHDREPFANNNAYQMLKADAEFILSKLPKKTRDDDDRDSKRDHH